MSTDGISAPGSSVYDSSTMFVGDGTWISTKNTFLLPNLQGLNFATMQLNSEIAQTWLASRFSALPQYHRLVIGHGVVAALVFLLIVPSAIFVARFYYRNPRLALRLHIYLQILTVALVTVVLILGWFAVGPERSLSNPHHGIGVALYTLVLIQFFGGALIHRIEKGKSRWKIPLKLMLHQWLGRAIALLGLAQIPLGMTLYGSPKYLYILYALAVFALIVLYFILCYIYQPVADYDDYSSYTSGPTRTEITDDRRTGRTRRTVSTGSNASHHGLRNTAFFGAGLAGLAALRRRSQSRRAQSSDRAKVPSHRSYPSGSYIEEEKIIESRPKSNTWRNRVLGAGAGLGAYHGLKRAFSRRQPQDEESYAGSSYAPTVGGSQAVNRVDVMRVQDGEAPLSPEPQRITRSDRTSVVQAAAPLGQPLRSRTSRDSFSSYDSRSSFEDDQPSRPIKVAEPGIIAGIGSMGLLGYFREKRKQSQIKKDNVRVVDMRQQERHNAERINRANSRRYIDRPRHRRPSIADTEATHDLGFAGSNPELSRHHLPAGNMPPLPASAATLPGSNQYSTTRLSNNDGPATLAPSMMGPAYPTQPGPVSMPEGAIVPDASRLARSNNTSRIHLPLEPIAAGPAAVSTSHSPSRPDYHERPEHHHNTMSQMKATNSPTSVASPPVSVKVKMHNDGRHVTLRRLNEDEAAAEREARRRERRQRRRRAESLSSGVEDESVRYRRAQGAVPSANSAARPPASSHPDELNLPPMQGPPPVPVHSTGMSPVNMAPSGMTSGIGSPGTYDTGTGTDLSAFDTNRKRRRAERAAQRSANQGARVEFS
ncbi:unnamed protein product [Aureobasidium vineae]|uniref:Cytochrome b561 domain-containing protein n=1 Tax=Aureobasidium vineae TaxID=2773715 RepID=A0A9N8JSV6_9PEZI|nr:unnamed protein product [Aureobasidium vineae]